jgi:hypothetical protein
VDPNTGEVLVVGWTFSLDFPTANPLQGNRGDPNTFVTRLSGDGRTLSFSTYLGGNASDFGQAVAVDPNTGDVLVTGYTNSRDFPTVNAFQPNYGGNYDAFVTRISF